MQVVLRLLLAVHIYSRLKSISVGVVLLVLSLGVARVGLLMPRSRLREWISHIDAGCGRLTHHDVAAMALLHVFDRRSRNFGVSWLLLDRAES